MTRINANIPTQALLDTHLIAEHRELVRVCSQLRKSGKVDPSKISKKFRLGSGHQTFFIDKGLFLYNRYKALQNEMINRGINFTDYSQSFTIYDQYPEYWNDYEFSDDENDLLRFRLLCRYLQMTESKFKYNKTQIDLDKAFELLDFKTNKFDSYISFVLNNKLDLVEFEKGILTLNDIK